MWFGRQIPVDSLGLFRLRFRCPLPAIEGNQTTNLLASCGPDIGGTASPDPVEKRPGRLDDWRWSFS